MGILLAGVLLAACSSSPGSSGSSSPPGSSSSGDKALATSELLPTSVYPAGWKGQGASSETTGASFFGGANSSEVSELASCIGISTNGIDTSPAEAAAQEYDDPSSNVTVTDTVDVFPTDAQAVADVEAAANPKTPSCFVQLLGPNLSQAIAQKLGQGATIGQVAASHGSLPSFGDHDAELVLSFPFTFEGVSGTEYLEFVTVQKDRSESNLQLSNSGSPAPSNVVEDLARAAAKQMS